ncbi:MAG: hypothetical protein JJU29_00795 [Verrucomicrobia bacterium]|nr:hypothetical protein [Verrucomicrobiota bacterium]
MKRCESCNEPLVRLGARRFLTGEKVSLNNQVQDPFDRMDLDVWGCPVCDRVFFYMEHFKEKAEIESHGGPKQHPRFKEYVREDKARKFFGEESLVKSFVRWLMQNPSSE